SRRSISLYRSTVNFLRAIATPSPRSRKTANGTGPNRSAKRLAQVGPIRGNRVGPISGNQVVLILGNWVGPIRGNFALQGGNRAAARGGDGDHRGEPGAEKKDLRLADLSRVPADTKAMVLQIVEQTRKRSGWRAYRTLAALGVPRSVYYAWKARESLEDKVGKGCRVYELLPQERT